MKNNSNARQAMVFIEIKTREQALAYMEDLLKGVAKARQQVEAAELVETKRSAYANLMTRYGQGIGALTTLVHVRMLELEDYARYSPRLRATIVPTVVVRT